MRAIAGQAVRVCGHVLHHMLQLAVALVVVVAVLVGALAWRLSQGPLELAWLARRLEQAVNADGPTRVSIGSAAIAWEGWRLGVDHSLDIRLADVAAEDPNGARIASIPRAELSLSAGWLLLGRFVPRAVEIDGARLRVLRAADGSVELDLGSIPDTVGDAVGAAVTRPTPPDANRSADATAAAPAPPPPTPAGQTTAAATPPAPTQAANPGESGPGGFSQLLHTLTQPPESDHGHGASRWAQMQRVRIHDAAITVVDQQLRATWSAPQVEIDLQREPQGGFKGGGDIKVALGGQTADLAIRATMASTGVTTIDGTLTPFNPGDLAQAVPALAGLAALSAPITLSGTTTLDPKLQPTASSLRAVLGAGQVAMGEGQLPFKGAELDASVASDGHADFKLNRLELSARPDATPTVVTAHGAARRVGAQYAATIAVDLDQVAFADLPALWPRGVGGKGTRPWITKNITGGVAHNMHVEAALTLPPDLSDPELTSIAGGCDGSDLTVWWLRPVPPIDHGDAHMTFVDADTIDIAVAAGRLGAITIQKGNVHITGIEAKDQFADIDGQLVSPLQDLLTLLKNPRIKLLDRRPIDMRDPSGQVAGKISVGHLPLRDNVSMDDLQIRTSAHLTNVHLGAIAAGRDLDRGTLDLDASNDGLSVKGNATVAGIPAQLAVDMDFRNGAPNEVLTKVTASGTADAKQLAATGVDVAGIVAGSAALKLGYLSRRDGSGEISASADLTKTSITVDSLSLRKREGAGATADVHAVLDHDRLVTVDRINVEGDGIVVRGSADVASSQPNVLHLQQVKIGATTDAHGDVRFPARTGDAYVVSLQGPSLDLSGVFARSGGNGGKSSAPSKAGEDKPGPPFRADARFDRVVTGEGRSISGVVASVDNDGRITRRADVSGKAGGAFKLAIEPARGGRHLSGRAADAAGLLRAMDVTDEMIGGVMTLDGNYDDARSDHPLAGTAELNDFRVRGALALGKVLQAMTLYGLADAVSGPGLNFDRLIAPFRITNDVLELNEARAFSSSLGMTAKGRIDLARNTADIEGTLVPAYFFNSLLGHIPLLGRLFSPEQGGGLFAATYTIRGSLASPSVSVNPLAALTPGFLRGIFGIFDGGKGPPARMAAPESAGR